MTNFIVMEQNDRLPSMFMGVALERDKWNDFNFQTQYSLWVAMPEFTGRIGTVKILQRGQTTADPIKLVPGSLPPLDGSWVSLGQDLDYYERLAELSDALRAEILGHLRDALAFPEHASTFFGEPGWNTSVLRYITWNDFQRDASVLLDRNYSKVARLDMSLTFGVAGWLNPLEINFQAPSDHLFWSVQDNKLPDRLAVIIGRNGSGKSTLLSRLARILHASQKDRDHEALTSLGWVTPKGIGFTRIVNVAYSAFDAFQLPGINGQERRQIVDDLERGVGRYHYCGLRDLVREVRQADGIGEIDGNPIPQDGPDRQATIILKSSEALTAEFEKAIARIISSERTALFAEVCRNLASDSSFVELGQNPGEAVMATPTHWFRTWSTGHKIVMHAAASIVAFTEPKSIVLIDEPESHLHPPLLAALMHAIRIILGKNDAFGIVVTHSPVVVQETLRRHISIVRRVGTSVTISKPNIETYGESIGEITNEVFGLNADATDFHQVLSRLVQSGMPLESIEKLFEPGLSLQARAYVMSEMARRPG